MADATTRSSLDAIDEVADDLTGPFVGFVKATTGVGRAVYDATSTGTRRVLAAA